MKYVLLVGDGMADYPIAELGQRTPLEAARTPNMDFMVQNGILGRVKTIPEKATPGSDVANISIMGYNPQEYYKGRGPLEAANLGIDLEEGDVAFRCNLVTVSGDIMADYSAGHISSKEGAILMKYLDDMLGSNRIRFFPGVSYRNLLLFKRGTDDLLQNAKCIPPHDISGKSVSQNLPKGDGAKILIGLMEESRRILERHEINQVRVDLKENPANMIWLWGQGEKPAMPAFKDKFGLSGSVISAVDLIKGLGRIIGLNVINVPGATGYYDTDYEAKARFALSSLEQNDFVFVHVEAPDEAGHNADLREKLTAIERFDQLVVGTMLEGLKQYGDFRILFLPDHATPISVKTHTSEPVPFGIYGSGVSAGNYAQYCEARAQESPVFIEKGDELMDYFIKGSKS